MLRLLIFSSFFFMLAALFSTAHAQDALPATTEVTYLATCIKDTVAGKVLSDTFRLRFNDDKALFYSVDKFTNDSIKFNNIDAWAKQVDRALTKGSRENKAGRCYYVLTDLNEGTYIYIDEIGMNIFRYTDSLPTFNWKILPERKTIAGHKCTKAMGKYMGRTYEAWYATDIPTRVGPWKFYGLPGLVMSVYDTQHQYNFTFIDMQPCRGEVALFPSSTFKTTKEKFLKEYDLYLNDPVAYYATRAVVRIEFNKPNATLPKKWKNESRHRPMEILK